MGQLGGQLEAAVRLVDSVSTFARTSLESTGLSRAARVLDAPCGHGRHSRWLAGEGYTVTALDCSKERLSEARQVSEPESDSIQWVVADIEFSWPILVAYFDLVIVIHYWSSEVLSRARASLKPGGWLIFETFAARGENWRELPSLGSVASLASPHFDLADFRERPVGPDRERAVVKLLGRRR